MKEAYEKSLQMIKILKIRTEKDYNKLQNYFLILNADSLKYMSNKKNFQDVIKLAKKVN